MNISLFRQTLSSTKWQNDIFTLSPQKQDWLLHQGSLTRKLQQYCQQLKVEIVAEKWVSDMSFGFTGHHEPIWLREVILKGDEQAWIFAQTRLPQSTIENVAPDIINVGSTPIGLWLFPQQPKRKTLEWIYDTATGLYARRSVLLLNQYPIEIKELFLQDFKFFQSKV
ncbi:chorismate--pyruvate lyase family protein [Histophilus somni]|uniref:chorismate--pyruvate lyase family protein n=1 Tax=Histophilus somni TaxID=731 RepID=UPI00109CB852|nr:chorismate lyase [Histophilus somni]QEH22259.1 chorismate lyase [Histophilus somni]THA45484.1 chorismate lyase [Histophilus somni]